MGEKRKAGTGLLHLWKGREGDWYLYCVSVKIRPDSDGINADLPAWYTETLKGRGWLVTQLIEESQSDTESL